MASTARLPPQNTLPQASRATLGCRCSRCLFARLTNNGAQLQLFYGNRRGSPSHGKSSEDTHQLGLASARDQWALLTLRRRRSTSCPTNHPLPHNTGRPAARGFHGGPPGQLTSLCRSLQTPQRLPPHRHRPGGVDSGRRGVRPSTRVLLAAALPHGSGCGRGLLCCAGSTLHW